MTARNGHRPAPYAVALASIVVATILRLCLDPLLGVNVPFATLFFAVLVTAWYGGFGPALVASLFGVVASVWFLLPPRDAMAVADGEHLGELALYLAISIGIALIGGAMREARRRAEDHAATAAAQREQLRVTLESIGDGVVVTDTKGRITSLNPVAVALTGWAQVDAIARPLGEVFQIVNEHSGAAVANPVSTVLAENRVVALANHTLLIARDGTRRPIDDTAAPIRDDGGRLVGAVLVFRDVTEKRRAEDRLRRSERELGDFFENANVGLHFVGPDGIILRVNQAELDLLGYERGEYVGRHIAEFHADRAVIDDILARLANGETLKEYPARLRCKDGTIKDVLVSSSVRWEEKRFIHTRCITLDVTQRRAAERAQALLAAVVESSDDAIITKTLDGIITSWNQGAERLFGYSAAEAIGQPILMIIPPDRQDEEPALLGRLRRGERIEHFETVRVAKDGRQLDISLTVSPVRDLNGTIIGASKVARDVTERRRAERALRDSEERFRSLTTNAPVAIFIKDLAGRYVMANPLACQALGSDAVVGRTDRELQSEAIADALRRRDIEVVATGQAIESEEVVGREGAERSFLSVKFPLGGGDGTIGVCGVAIDITDRKRAEDELRLADRRKDAFLATLAHELRNPLAPVRNSLEIVKRASGDAGLVERSLATMERQLAHLERLVEDLLDISRISRDRLDLRRQPVELATVIEQAVDICRPQIDAGHFDLRVRPMTDSIVLDADPVRLAQVFSNLLNNACKYTRAGGTIEISARRDGSDALVVIRDSGDGIPRDMLHGIFDMFTQLEPAPGRTQSGLGIGLTLVKRLIELHGGTVEARSDGPGLGSEFVVRLPMTAAPPARAAEPAAPAPTSGARRRVLVVDDNADAAESLATLLQISGHDTHLVHDGEAAIAAAERFRPDVVLLDIGLPKMSGHDVAREIRAHAWGRDMMLVALTGWGQEEDRRKSREIGFDHHLVKPIDLAALMQLLDAPGAGGAA